MNRTFVLLLLLASGAALTPEAVAQPRFSKPLALPADSVLRSATGRFVVRVSEGWEAGSPSGEMLQGEFLLAHNMDSTYFSPAWVPHSWASNTPPEDLVDAMLDQLVFVMSGEGDPAAEDWFDVLPRQTREVDGHSFTSQSIREVYPGMPEVVGPVMHFGLLEAVDGAVLIIAATPPNADPARWEALVTSLRILPLD